MPLITDTADGARCLPLDGGGIVSWREYGAPGGFPVFFFHGWPSSSRQASGLSALASQAGLRLISIDRPGIGHSTRLPGRNFLHLPPLVDAIARAHGINRARMLGISGGGPCALACTWALPFLIERAVVVCGAPPVHTPEALAHFHPLYRSMIALHRAAPQLFRYLLALPVNCASIRPPWLLIRQALRLLPPRDQLALTNRERFEDYYPGFQHAMRSGFHALCDDGECYIKPWPFDVREISRPVHFWHGSQDNNFHWTLARDLAAGIPGATFTLREEGHYSLPLHCGQEIINSLLPPAV